jgi:multidrug efflux pump subunit AcrA (membrane-fusion protein)
VGSRPETIREAEAEVDRLRASLGFLSQQIERTEIRSPIAGVVSTHRLKDRLTTFLEIGDEICEIVSCGRMLVETPVSEKDVIDVREGMPVKLKARSLPAASFAGKVVSVPPVAIDRMNRTVLIVTSQVENPRHLLKPGMTGTARIYCGKHRLIDLLTRKIIRFVRVEFWWW